MFQILRSSSEWSAGLYDTERSIQNGYLYAIEKSEHFIYIEVEINFDLLNHVGKNCEFKKNT